MSSSSSNSNKGTTKNNLRRYNNNKSNRQHTLVGRKQGTKLKRAHVKKECKIFVSRLDSDVTCDQVAEFVSELTGDSPKIEKLTTKFPNYSSFKITCDKSHLNTLLDLDEWEEGVIVRPFYERKSIETLVYNNRAVS